MSFIIELYKRKLKKDFGEKADKAIAFLEAKEKELAAAGKEEDDEATAAVVTAALDILRADGVLPAAGSKEAAENTAVAEAEISFIDKQADIVNRILTELGLSFDKKKLNGERYVFLFPLGKKRLSVTIFIDDNPKLVMIKVGLPFSGEATYIYPLSREIAKFNYQRIIGTLTYIEDTGELIYKYAFDIEDGINPDIFKRAFFHCVTTAEDAYDKVKKYAFGKFSEAEKREILRMVEELVRDITNA